jgi:head-tail adaptor
MPTYRMTIERTVRFQLDVEADTRLDALRMVNTKALMYDDRDLKETRVIAIKELEEVAILHPLD